jgi:hypothetical protein
LNKEAKTSGYGLSVGETRTPYKQKFFGAFSQKRTATFLT